MNTKDEEAEDEYSTDEFEESMDGDVDTKAAAQDYESDEFEVCFEKKTFSRHDVRRKHSKQESDEEVEGKKDTEKQSKGWNHIDYDELEIKEQIAGT